MNNLKVIGTIVAGVFIVGFLINNDSDENEPATRNLSVASTSNSDRTADAETETIQNAQESTRPAPEPSSPWRVREDVSPMDDSKSVFLNTQSNERIPGRYGRAPGNATLFVRCVENTTALILQMNGNHMSSSPYHDWGHVQMRIDDKQAFTKQMSASTNHQSLGLWRGGQSIPVIRQMFGADQITVRATPYGESPITMTFDISKLEDEISPLRAACNW